MNLPDWITVHLGPLQKEAENITVTFCDYLKNVACGENLPTWPEAAIQVNICITAAFTIQCLQNKNYRGQGYCFDITNDRTTDPYFYPDRGIFDNIAKLVDEMYPDSFIHAYPNIGKIRYCPGFYPWESVDLISKGFDAERAIATILGKPVQQDAANRKLPVYVYPLKRGNSGVEVRQLQNWLNRISSHYAGIPKICPADGIFEEDTEKSVIAFQQIFGQKADGIAEKGTWYKILFVYQAVQKFSHLGQKLRLPSCSPLQLSDPLKEQDTGETVSILHRLICFLSLFDPYIPEADYTETYDNQTKAAVISFQLRYGLEGTGTVGFTTWESLLHLYKSVWDTIPQELWVKMPTEYPGYSLAMGMRGSAVQTIQECLLALRETNPLIPPLYATGTYNAQTKSIVSAFQKMNGILPNGIVDQETWNAILSAYNDLQAGKRVQYGQYPGYIIKEGECDPC